MEPGQYSARICFLYYEVYKKRKKFYKFRDKNQCASGQKNVEKAGIKSECLGIVKKGIDNNWTVKKVYTDLENYFGG